MHILKIIILFLIIFVLYKFIILKSNKTNKSNKNKFNNIKIEANKVNLKKFNTCDQCPFRFKCKFKCQHCINCPLCLQKKNILLKNNKSCISCFTDTDADTYLRTRLIERKDVCRQDETYTNNELKNYRDRHFAFRNKVFQTSKDVDMVDKLNYLEQVGSYDVSRNKKGQRISDMYDFLTRSDDLIMPQMHKDFKSEKPIQRIMEQTGIPIEGHNGDMWSNQNWAYGFDGEKDMNGGSFYNNITGYDGQFNPPQSVPK